MKKAILLLSLALTFVLVGGCKKQFSYAVEGTKWRSISPLLDEREYGLCFTEDGKVIWDSYENNESVLTLNGTYEYTSDKKKVILSGIAWSYKGVDHLASKAYYSDLDPSTHRLAVEIVWDSDKGGVFYQSFDPE